MLKPAPYAMPIEKAMFYAGWAFTAIVLLFLIAPILAVMPLSFNAEPYFSYPMPGLSLQWYRDFFGNERWWGAAVSAVPLALSEQALVLRVREGGATQRASARGYRGATGSQLAAERQSRARRATQPRGACQ